MSAPIFATLGCRLNAYETEAMKELSAAAGVENAVVVNTCAVTAEAVQVELAFELERPCQAPVADVGGRAALADRAQHRRQPGTVRLAAGIGPRRCAGI